MGKLPPPYIGPAMATQIILNSSLKDRYNLIHLDLSDHRDINTLAKWDFTNIYLAFKHYLLLVYYILKYNPVMIYMPIGQTTVSYIRDSVFVLITKILGKKILCHLRGGNFKTWYNRAGFLMQWWVRLVHKKINGQIVLGNNLIPLFNWLIPKDKIYVIPNGANYIYPPPKTVENNRVLFLSNFIDSKGIIEVLNAAVIVQKKIPKTKFIFAGSWRDNETKEKFKSIMNNNPLLGVEVVGPVKGIEKTQLLSDTDIFILPTYYPNEGHPWVIVEAMAAGLPIISTNQGAISESVIHGVNGFIIEPKRPDQIAEKLIYLIENQKIREKMGQASRQHYLKNFTEEKMVARLESAFEKIIN